MATDTDVLIIGAGISGLCMAIQLVRNYPNVKFQLIEKSDDIGGTWHVNSYPGCGCDVPSHFFSYSFELNPNWSQKFAMQPEIEAYYNNIANKYDIPRRVALRTAVESAEWHEMSKTWSVIIRDQNSKELRTVRSSVLVSAVGALSIPKNCDIPGAEEFGGKLFHSAAWDHSFDYSNKEIVVLGNGCSATQFVPIISKTSKHVTQFARQPHWLLERPNPSYGSVVKAFFRWLPGFMRAYRAYFYATLEAEFAMFKTEAGRPERQKLIEASKTYIATNAPPKYFDALIPKIELGCKRRVFDTGYLDCMHRENFELVWKDPVTKIVKGGVELSSGRVVAADAIILANGFESFKLLQPMEIRGERGMSLQDHWNQVNEGVPQAYYGTCVANFPNFFILMGPNTATGHLSVIYTSECQVNFTLRALDPILRSLYPSSLQCLVPWPKTRTTASSMRVTPMAEARDNTWIQAATQKLVFSTGCSSWYVDPKTGKNAMLYPSWEWHYWLRSVFLKRKDFQYTDENRIGTVGTIFWWLATVLILFQLRNLMK